MENDILTGKIGKLIKIGTEFVMINLSSAEETKLLDDLLESNIDIMNKCLEKSKTFVVTDHDNDKLKIALALFESMSTKSYTALLSALLEKVHYKKNEQLLEAE